MIERMIHVKGVFALLVFGRSISENPVVSASKFVLFLVTRTTCNDGNCDDNSNEANFVALPTYPKVRYPSVHGAPLSIANE